jgi:H(+)-transporting ATP synthase subunit D
MKAATRSRWLELTRRRLAARRGRQMLEEKRGALLAAVAAARGRRDEARDRAAAALDTARGVLTEAEIELGAPVVEAAALAQIPGAGVGFDRRSLLGVPLTQLSAASIPFRLGFAPGGTSVTLDRAAFAFARAVPLVLGLAQEELTLRGLTVGLARTSRRCNALEYVVLPELEREIRHIESTLEEESRDEAVRTRRRRSEKFHRKTPYGRSPDRDLRTGSAVQNGGGNE